MTLPERPSLEWLRNAARQLLRAARAGDPDALARFATGLPGVALSLSAAQAVIAREHGFPGWPALKTDVEARTRRVRRPSATQLRVEAEVAAMLAAARTGDPSALALRPGVGSAIQRAARDLLAARPDDRGQVLRVLLQGLTHANPSVRYECAHALDTYGDTSCIASLLALTDDPVPRVRRIAIHALSCHACKPESFAGSDAVRDRLARAALSDPSVQVRRHAVVAVAQAGGPGAADILRQALAQDSDMVVQRNCRATLRRI